MTPVEEAAVYAIASQAAATRMCSIVARRDVVKVLTLGRRYEEARIIDAIDDETYGAIVARHIGAAKGPKTPPGEAIDPDGKR